MKAQIRMGALALALIGVVALVSPAGSRAATPHTVTEGETLWSIASAGNLTTRTVAVFNGLSEDAVVLPGQTVQIPTVDEGAAALSGAGITPGTPSADPAAAADPATPDPAAAPVETSSGGAAHTVVAGETLSTIAAANGLSISALASANGRSADSFVYEGESVQIPALDASTAATTASTAGPGSVPSPYGELQLDPAAAESWNAMRDESVRSFGQDLYPAGPISAGRTYEQQAQLYEDYLNGVGPLAAPPGTSSHETGTAVDLPTPEMRAVIDQIGASFRWGKLEAPEEWWHVNYGG